MHIATWNIRNGGGRRASTIASVVDTLNADVMVLTEYTPNGVLSDALNAKGWCLEVAQPGERQLGVAIVSKARMGDLGVKDPCDPWAGVKAVKVGDLTIVGIYGPGKSSHIPGTTARIKQRWWNGLLEYCDTWRSSPTVIIGDFNNGINGVDGPPDAFVHSELFAELSNRGFRDGWRTIHRDAPAWSLKHKRYGERRLDHVFCSESVSVEQAEYLTSHQGRTLVSDPDAPTAGALSDHAALSVSVSATR